MGSTLGRPDVVSLLPAGTAVAPVRCQSNPRQSQAARHGLGARPGGSPSIDQRENRGLGAPPSQVNFRDAAEAAVDRIYPARNRGKNHDPRTHLTGGLRHRRLKVR